MKKRLYTRFKNSRIDTDHIVAVVCIILAISVMAVPAIAQSVSQSDDFENGNADGWEGLNLDVVQEAPGGSQYSLRQLDGYGDPENRGVWTAGPVLDLQEEFTIDGTTRPVVDGTNSKVAVGIIDGNDEGSMIVFSDEFGATFVANSTGSDDTAGAIQNDYHNTWVNFEIHSPPDSSTMEAKVWEVGSAEPSTYQISRELETQSGPFSIRAGPFDQTKEIYLDSVNVSGSLAEDPTLRLDTGNYLGFGETQDYTVYDLVGENDIRNDVSKNATVTSGNTSVITVDKTQQTLTATTDKNVSTRVNITAQYEGRSNIVQVTVAEQSVSNLDVLPFMGRIGAMFLDRGFQMILVGLLLSIAATRVGGVYAGLGVYQMSLTAGWLIGFVPIGLAFVGLFTTLFIGLNIAANIDYSVRR